jgi:hypothetical protein
MWAYVNDATDDKQIAGQNKNVYILQKLFFISFLERPQTKLD